MSFKQIKTDTVSFFKSIILLTRPQTKSEKIIFSLIFVLYIGFSFFFVFNTNLLDHPEVNSDTFLGFDSQHISRRGFPYISSHPFMAIFSMPLVIVGDLMAYVFGFKAKTMFLVVICTYIIVQSQIIVRRYILNIIELNIIQTNIISLFFAFFSYNFAVALSFDSFAFSFFLLCIATYYFSEKIKSKENISIVSGIFLVLSVGGITITNFSKILSVYFFEKTNIKYMLRKQFIVFSTFVFSFFGLGIVLFIVFGRERVLDLHRRYEEFSQTIFHQPEEIFETVISRFFGAPVLLSDYMVVDRDWPDGPYTLASNYVNNWQYIFVFILLALLLWSLIANHKNRVVLFIAFNFLIDFIIHIVFEYGLGESFIYAAHWIFSFPILLGWLIKSQRQKARNLIIVIISMLSVIALVNNVIEYYELYNNFGLIYFGTN